MVPLFSHFRRVNPASILSCVSSESLEALLNSVRRPSRPWYEADPYSPLTCKGVDTTVNRFIEMRWRRISLFLSPVMARR